MIAQHQEEALAAPEVQDDFDLGPEEEQALEVKDKPEVRDLGVIWSSASCGPWSCNRRNL